MRSESIPESPIIEEVYRILSESRKPQPFYSPNKLVEKIHQATDLIKREPGYLIPSIVPALATLVGLVAQNQEMIEVCKDVTICGFAVTAFCYGFDAPFQRWFPLENY